jgi:hypothetical protein
MATEKELAAELADSEKARTEMLQAVGQAISDWAQVEEGLFAIFVKVMGSPALGPPSCAFVAAENMRTKIKIVDSMIRHSSIGRKVLPEWETLHKRCNKLRSSRNAVAHRRVTMLKIGKAKAQPALIAYNYDMRHILEEEFRVPSHLKIDRVQKLSKDFRQLGVDLLKFSNGIQHSAGKS